MIPPDGFERPHHPRSDDSRGPECDRKPRGDAEVRWMSVAPYAEADKDKLRGGSRNSDDQEEQNIAPAVPGNQNARCDSGDGSKPAPDCASVGGDDRCGQRSESRKLDGKLHSHRSPPAGRTEVG